MAGPPTVQGNSSTWNSEFRVEKSRSEARLTLSNGALVRGYFFVSGGSRAHAGPERIKDVLNAEPGFVPFEVAGSGGAYTALYNRDHIIMAELADNGEASADPGYNVAVVRNVAMLLSNGARLHGVVRVYHPHGHDRLSDFARSGEAFRYLEAERATYLINVRHLLELSEESPAS
jgi:hypothetical protein